jgi:hypothetical protein
VFRREQISAIPFKGPVFSAQLYGNVVQRRCGDLDVLIRGSDVSRCAELMRGQGYIPQLRLAWEWSFQRGRFENVDVHWSVMDEVHQFPLTPDQLWERHATVRLCGQTVPVLCNEDALLALSFNGLKEGWKRFDRLRDIAALMRKNNEIDWRSFLAACRRWGCERIVLVGMFLANELFLAELPDDLHAPRRSHRKAMRAAGWVRDQIMIDPVGTSLGIDDWTYFPRLRERLWEKIPYCQIVAYSIFKAGQDEPKWQQTLRRGLYRSLRLPLIAIKRGLLALGHPGIKD